MRLVVLAVLGLSCLAACAPSKPPSITGTWHIKYVNDTPVTVPEGRTAEFTLSDDHTFSASIGCNQISGDYQLDGLELVFTTGPMTRMACPPPLDALETALLDAMAMINSYKVDLGELHLLTDDASVVILDRDGH